MFTGILFLILFLPAAFLPLALDTSLSRSDLDEMGIALENSDYINPGRDEFLLNETRRTGRKNLTAGMINVTPPAIIQKV